MEQEAPPTLHRVAPDLAERQTSIPRIGDVWVPRATVSPNHFVRLYIPRVEDLFSGGDRLLRVEHSGLTSRLISWRVWKGQAEQWRFQQESSDEQIFFLISSDFLPLRPVTEGEQSTF
jgi:hypothetical protein